MNIIKEVERELSLEERRAYFNMRYYGYIDILKDIKPRMRVLDVGFEPGHLAMALEKMGCDVYGITNELWYSQSEKRIKRYGIKYCIRNAETDMFPYRGDIFDVVVMSEIMEHFYLNCYNALRESYRVLKSGGKIIITTPNAVSGHKRLCLLFGKLNREHARECFKRGIYHKHHFLYKLDELADLARDVGFRIAKKEYIRLDERIYMKGKKHREYKFKGLNMDYVLRKIWYLLGVMPSWRSHIKVVGKK